jgi:hypothetical protein
MNLVDCIIGGAVLCGSFLMALWVIEPEAAPQRSQDQQVSHYNDLTTATLNAGLARNGEQQRRYDRIDEILAQRQPTRTPKDSEAREGERARRDFIKASNKTLAKKHHPDQIDALLREVTPTDSR